MSAADICAAFHRCPSVACGDRCDEYLRFHDDAAIETCKGLHNLLSASGPNGHRKTGEECAPEDCNVDCQEWREHL